MQEDTADERMDAEGESTDGERTLADRVEEVDADLGEAVADLEARVEDLEARVAEEEERADDFESRLKRKQADFQNYKKRAKKRQEELEERATEDLIGRLAPVRNDLVRALDQDEDVDIRDGVESTLEAFDRVLEEEGVTVIDPAPGDDVDPVRHQVMMRTESEQPEGTVVDVYRHGYEMAGSVIQEAQVTVSDGT